MWISSGRSIHWSVWRRVGKSAGIFVADDGENKVHIFYEAFGTGAAFFSSYLIMRLGSNYSMIMTPICFLLAAALWWNIGALGFVRDPDLQETSWLQGIRNGNSAYISNSKTLWLIAHSFSRLRPLHRSWRTISLLPATICLATARLLVGALCAPLPGERSHPRAGPRLLPQTFVRADIRWWVQPRRDVGSAAGSTGGKCTTHTYAVVKSRCADAGAGVDTSVLRTTTECILSLLQLSLGAAAHVCRLIEPRVRVLCGR